MAISGGTVCIMHGGSAPQVKASAQDRLLLLGMIALDVMEELAAFSEQDQIRFQAARDLMNRAKIGEGVAVRLEDGIDRMPLEEVEARLIEIGRQVWARAQETPCVKRTQ